MPDDNDKLNIWARGMEPSCIVDLVICVERSSNPVLVLGLRLRTIVSTSCWSVGQLVLLVSFTIFN